MTSKFVGVILKCCLMVVYDNSFYKTSCVDLRWKVIKQFSNLIYFDIVSIMDDGSFIELWQNTYNGLETEQDMIT